MKNYAILLSCLVCFSFTKSSPDLTFLYQTWTWNGWNCKNGHVILTYKPGKELNHNYGYQFRKDGTVSVCQNTIVDIENFQFVFQVVEGRWEISEDSIIKISNASSYIEHETLVLRELSANELVVSIP